MVAGRRHLGLFIQQDARARIPAGKLRPPLARRTASHLRSRAAGSVGILTSCYITHRDLQGNEGLQGAPRGGWGGDLTRFRVRSCGRAAAGTRSYSSQNPTMGRLRLVQMLLCCTRLAIQGGDALKHAAYFWRRQRHQAGQAPRERRQPGDTGHQGWDRLGTHTEQHTCRWMCVADCTCGGLALRARGLVVSRAPPGDGAQGGAKKCEPGCTMQPG